MKWHRLTTVWCCKYSFVCPCIHVFVSLFFATVTCTLLLAWILWIFLRESTCFLFFIVGHIICVPTLRCAWGETSNYFSYWASEFLMELIWFDSSINYSRNSSHFWFLVGEWQEKVCLARVKDSCCMIVEGKLSVARTVGLKC